MNRQNVIKICIPNQYDFLCPLDIKDYVRLGKNNDGGYIIPTFLTTQANSLLSFGIGEDWSFEESWRQYIPNGVIHCYDQTTVFENLSKRKQKKYKQCFKDNTKHFKIMVGNGSDQISFEQALLNLDSNKVFVKMDIESSEYDHIDSIVQNCNNILGLVVEFHECFDIEQRFIDAVKKLQTKFSIVHLHGNNAYYKMSYHGLPELFEITFVRSDLINSTIYRKNCYLDTLDQPNWNAKEDFYLYFD